MHVLVRTQMLVPHVHKALILLTRLKQRYPKVHGTHLAGHRLFVASAMLVCDMEMDVTYRRSSWVDACKGLFTGRS